MGLCHIHVSLVASPRFLPLSLTLSGTVSSGEEQQQKPNCHIPSLDALRGVHSYVSPEAKETRQRCTGLRTSSQDSCGEEAQRGEGTGPRLHSACSFHPAQPPPPQNESLPRVQGAGIWAGTQQEGTAKFPGLGSCPARLTAQAALLGRQWLGELRMMNDQGLQGPEESEHLCLLRAARARKHETDH